MMLATVTHTDGPQEPLVSFRSMENSRVYRVHGPLGTTFDWYAAKIAFDVLLIVDLQGVVSTYNGDEATIWSFSKARNTELNIRIS